VDGLAAPMGRYSERESMELSFVVALQRLPPRQRAAVLLSEVLGLAAHDVADALGTTVPSVEVALRGARAALAGLGCAPGRERRPPPGSQAERELVGRFARALVRGEVERMVALLAPAAWAGLARFLSALPPGDCPARLRLVATRANTQPALACYLSDRPASGWRPYGLMVLTLDDPRITAVAGFRDLALFPRFGLPLE
jgi:RNA polymerase sigma-70 factor (ECF subfamily)